MEVNGTRNCPVGRWSIPLNLLEGINICRNLAELKNEFDKRVYFVISDFSMLANQHRLRHCWSLWIIFPF